MLQQGFSRVVLVAIALFFIIFTSAYAVNIAPAGGRSTYFTENRGQWDSRVLYKADGAGGLTWFIERDGATLLFMVPDSNDSQPFDSQRIKQMKRMGDDPFDDLSALSASSSAKYRAHALKFKFQHAIPSRAGRFLPDQTAPAIAASVELAERLSWNNNYFLGNDQSKWAPDCGNFQRLTLTNVWDSIDVVWRITGKHVEFDFVVKPGADLSDIRVACLGLTGDLSSTSDGEELLLPTSLGVLRQALPEAYLVSSNGIRSEIRSHFVVGDNGASFGISVPEGYHPGKTLVVDPLVWSTYLGGKEEEILNALVVDSEGCVYIAGRTRSTDYPISEGAFRKVFSRSAVGFVSCLCEDGATLDFSTYLGSSDFSSVTALVLDGDGNLFLTGDAYGGGFPTTEGAAYRTNAGKNDAFVTQISGDGTRILRSTLIGGWDSDFGLGIALDNAGGVVITGWTLGWNYPVTEGAFDNVAQGWEAFVSRFSLDLSRLIYSTYLGGKSVDQAFAIVSDGVGGVFVGGSAGKGFPTTEGVLDNDPDHYGGFITRLNENGAAVFSTYVPGHVSALAYDDSNDDIIFLSGNVSRLSGDGRQLKFSWGSGGRAAIIDTVGGIIITGATSNPGLITTKGAYDTTYNGALDAFLMRISANGKALLYTSYIGGNSDDWARAVAVDKEGAIFIGGYTQSTNFPFTQGVYDQSYNGKQDAFVMKFNSIFGEKRATIDRQEIIFNNVPVGRTVSTKFVLADSGMHKVEIKSILCGAEAFTTDWDGQPFTINPLESKTFNVTFTPISNISFESQLTILTDDPLNEEIVLPLRGAGTQAVLSLDTTLVDYGDVGLDSTYVETVSIFNRGNGTLYIRKAVVEGSAFATDFKPIMFIKPDSVGLLQVTFSPSELIQYEGKLTITHNDSLQEPVKVTLRGRGVILDVRDDRSVIPTSFSCQTYPNPFNSRTKIDYALPQSTYMTLKVFDINGRLVATLVDGRQVAGYHTAEWNAIGLPSGLYFARLEMEGKVHLRKMMLVK